MTRQHVSSPTMARAEFEKITAKCYIETAEEKEMHKIGLAVEDVSPDVTLEFNDDFKDSGTVCFESDE